MPRLTLVTNPVNRDKVEFNCAEPTLGSLTKKFLDLHPEFSNNILAESISVRINGSKIKYTQKDISLKANDSIIIYPDIEDPFTLTALLVNMAAAAVTSTVTTLAGTGIAASATAGGTAFAGPAGITGAAAVGAVGVEAAVAQGLIIGASTIAASRLANQAFQGHTPSMSGSSDGSPGVNSPSLGWDVKQMANEGIPIPILYGTNKVGGNIISSYTESSTTPAFEWLRMGDKNCQNMILPIGPFPFFNAGLIGLWPPVRGAYFKLNSRVWLYGILTIKLWNFGDWKQLLKLLMDKKLLTSATEFNNITSILTGSIRNFIERNKIRDFVNPNRIWIKGENSFIDKIKNTVDRLKRGSREIFVSSNPDAESILPFTEFSIIDNDWGTATKDSGVWDYAVRYEVREWLRFKLLNKNISFDYVQPLLHGTDWFKIWDDETSAIDNAGAYLVMAVVLLPDAVVPQWWISDGGALTFSTGDIHINRNFVIESPFQIQRDEEQRLHQLIALGEGPCEGIEKVFINDNPIDNFIGADFGFLDGSNDQSFGSDAAIVTEMDGFNKTAVTYTRNNVLENGGDFAEFVTDPTFPANNVKINIQFQASRLSVKGKLTDLGSRPIKFVIAAGFEYADFSDIVIGNDGDITSDSKVNGQFLSFTYQMWGGQTEPFQRSFSAFPFVNLMNGNLDVLIHFFPGGAAGAAAFLNDGPLQVVDPETELTGDVIWLKYALDTVTNRTGYKQAVFDALKESYDDSFVRNRKRIRVRIIRVTPPVDNLRYTDKMVVKTFEEINYTGFEYPNTSVLGVGIRASEQLHGGVPKITAIVKGKKIRVPSLILKGETRDLDPATQLPLGVEQDDGFGVYVHVYHDQVWYDEDIEKYRSMQNGGAECLYYMPDDNGNNRTDGTGIQHWSEEYSENPIWCLHDLLTNRRYGLGNYIEQADTDIANFKSMAEYCDQMVPDGTARWAEDVYTDSSNQWFLRDLDSDYFEKDQMFYDEDTKTFIKHLGEQLSDRDFYTYKKSLIGECLFVVRSTNEDGTRNWTRGVIEDATRAFVTPGDLLSSYTVLAIFKAYNNEFWTNQAPISLGDGTRVQYQLAQKRFRLNLPIDDRSGALDRVKQICDTFRCWPIWINGAIKPVINKPESSSAVIGMGNIIKDSLTITYSSLIETPNVITCQFMNEDNYYEKDNRQVMDPDIDVVNETDITKTLRRENIKLFGITAPAQVSRELRWRLLDRKLNLKAIAFKVGIEFLTIHAGDKFDFTHDIMIASGLSGRILEYVGGEVILDQDASSLASLDVRMQIKHIVAASGDVDAYEYTAEYTVSSIVGNRVTVLGLVSFPAKYDNYSIGIVNQVTKSYRAVTVAPSEDGEALIVATEDNESVFGARRYLFGSGIEYTMYDDTNLAAQDNTVGRVPTLFRVEPVTNLRLRKDSLSPYIRVTFVPPLNARYDRAKVQLKVGDGGYDEANQVIIDSPINTCMIGVGPGSTIPLDVLCSVRVYAIYNSDQTSIPVEAEIKIINGVGGSIPEDEDPDEEDTVIFTPGPISNLRLARVSKRIKDWLNPNSREWAYANFIAFRWKRAVFQGQGVSPFGNKDNKIDYYQIGIRAYENNSATGIAKHSIDLAVGPWVTFLNFEIGDFLTVTTQEHIEAIKMVTITIYAIANTGQEGPPKIELFYATGETPEADPEVRPLDPASKVFIIPGWWGVWVHWQREESWIDIKKFHITLVGWSADKNPKVDAPTWTSYGNDSTNRQESWNYSSFFRISKEDRQNYLGAGPFGIMWGAKFEATVMVENMQGVFSEATTSGDGGRIETDASASGSGTDGGNDTQIEDYGLAPTAQNVTIYDNKSLFLSVPSIVKMRQDIYQLSTYASRQNLIDNDLSTGVEYTGLTNIFSQWKVARIAYDIPTEKLYTKVTFTISAVCRVWVEYLQADLTGQYVSLGANWRYYTGTASNNLNSGKFVSRVNAIDAKSKYWLAPSGNNEAIFPVNTKTRFIRLVLMPAFGTTVTLSELKFYTADYFDFIGAASLTSGKIVVHPPGKGYVILGTEGNSDAGLIGKDSNENITFWINAEDGTTNLRPMQSGGPNVTINTGLANDEVIEIVDDGIAIALKDAFNAKRITIGNTGSTSEINLLTSDASIEVSNGDININAGGDINVKAAADIEVESGGDVNVQSGARLDILSGGRMDIESGGDLNVLAAGNIDIEADGNLNLDAGGKLNIDGGIINIDASSSMAIDAGASLDIQGGSITIDAANDLTLDGTTLHIAATNIAITGLNELDISSGGSFHIKNQGNVTLGGEASAPSFDFDVENSKFTVGNSETKAIVIAGGGGEFGYIGSKNFVSGLLVGQGQGFRMYADGRLEANDVSLRGALRSTAFVYEEISAVGGRLSVSKAGTLGNPLSSEDRSMYVENDPGFAIDDWIQIKEGVTRENMQISRVGANTDGWLIDLSSNNYEIRNGSSYLYRSFGTDVVLWNIYDPPDASISVQYFEQKYNLDFIIGEETTAGGDFTSGEINIGSISSYNNKIRIETSLYHSFDFSSEISGENNNFGLVLNYGTDLKFELKFAAEGLYVNNSITTSGEILSGLISQNEFQDWIFDIDKSNGASNATVDVYLNNNFKGNFDCSYSGSGFQDGLMIAKQGIQGYAPNNTTNRTRLDYLYVSESSTVESGVVPSSTSKKFGVSASSFTGQENAYLSTSEAIDIDGNEAFIIDAQLKIASGSSGEYPIISQYQDAENNWRWWYDDTTGLNFSAKASGESDITVIEGSANLSEDTWSQALITRSGEFWKIFSEGEQVVVLSGELGSIPNLYPIDTHIGRYNTERFKGEIDELRIVLGSYVAGNFDPPLNNYNTSGRTTYPDIYTLDNCNTLTGWELTEHNSGTVTQTTFSGENVFELNAPIAVGFTLARIKKLFSTSTKNEKILSVRMQIESMGPSNLGTFSVIFTQDAFDFSAGYFDGKLLIINEGGSQEVVSFTLNIWQKWRFHIFKDTRVCDVYLDDVLQASSVPCVSANPLPVENTVRCQAVYFSGTSACKVNIDYIQVEKQKVSGTELLMHFDGIGNYNVKRGTDLAEFGNTWYRSGIGITEKIEIDTFSGETVARFDRRDETNRTDNKDTVTVKYQSTPPDPLVITVRGFMENLIPAGGEESQAISFRFAGKIIITYWEESGGRILWDIPPYGSFPAQVSVPQLLTDKWHTLTYVLYQSLGKMDVFLTDDVNTRLKIVDQGSIFDMTHSNFDFHQFSNKLGSFQAYNLDYIKIGSGPLDGNDANGSLIDWDCSSFAVGDGDLLRKSNASAYSWDALDPNANGWFYSGETIPSPTFGNGYIAERNWGIQAKKPRGSSGFSKISGDVGTVPDDFVYSFTTFLSESIHAQSQNSQWFNIDNGIVTLNGYMARGRCYINDGTQHIDIGSSPQDAARHTFKVDTSGEVAGAVVSYYHNDTLKGTGSCALASIYSNGYADFMHSGEGPDQPESVWGLEKLSVGNNFKLLGAGEFLTYDWEKGAALVDLGGKAGDGFILMDSQSANSPYIDIVERSGSEKWDDYGLKLRMGRLDGISDITDGTWNDANPGYGLYCDNVYVKGNIRIGEQQELVVDNTGAVKLFGSSALIEFWFSEATKSHAIGGDGGDFQIHSYDPGGRLNIDGFKEITLQTVTGSGNDIYIDSGGRVDMSGSDSSDGGIILPVRSSHPNDGAEENLMYVYDAGGSGNPADWRLRIKFLNKWYDCDLTAV